MVDTLFADPRLAAVYDHLDPERPDLHPYVQIVEELGARRVLDVGCGTGTFACRLALRRIEVVGLDPAEASLAMARAKPGAERVRWICGVAADLGPLEVDLVTMTANVAQVFTADADWAATLRATHAALGPGGRLVFESRDPAAEAWRDWTPARTRRRVEVPHVGGIETWLEVTGVRGELVTFRTTFVLEVGGTVLTSESTLRFRSRAELTSTLVAAGFAVDDVREAADRPGREMVFVAARNDSPDGRASRHGPPR